MNEPRIIQLLNLRLDSESKNFSNPMAYRVYSAQGICPAIMHMGGGNHEPKIIEIMEPKILRRERTDEAKEQRRRGIAKFGNKQYSQRSDGCSNTLTTFENDFLLFEPSMLGYTRDNNGKIVDRHEINVANTIHTSTGDGGNTDLYVFYPEKEYTQGELREMIMSGKARVRKLTARECFRLQRVDDEDIDNIYATGLSNNQMIGLAGNSITVDVMYHILRKLYIDTQNENTPTLFDLME